MKLYKPFFLINYVNKCALTSRGHRGGDLKGSDIKEWGGRGEDA